MATLAVSRPLATGTHALTAKWPGTGIFAPITLTGAHAVIRIPVTIAITSTRNPVSVGQDTSIGVSTSNSPGVPASAPVPTGTTVITDNGVTISTTTQVSSTQLATWTFGHGFATSGKHTITATYSGDALHDPAIATLIENVNPHPTTAVLQSSPNPASYEQPVTFTATITALPDNYVRELFNSSTVTFTGLPGGPVVAPVVFPFPPTSSSPSLGIATYTTSTLPPGTYTITATFPGNASLNPSTSAPVTEIISAATTTTVSASPNPAYASQTVTLSAHVTGSLGAPTGAIQFLDNGAFLSTVPLTSGSATFATALLAPGTHTVTAVYTGDTNNLPSTSISVTETILPSGFTLSIDPASLTIVTGHHSTLTLTATSVGAFADTLTLSIGPLPKWTTVTFTPTALHLTQGGTATSRVYVDTDAVIGYLSQTGPNPVHPDPTNRTCTTITVGLSLILLPVTCRRARRIHALIALAIAATLLSTSTGCSGMYPTSTTPGNYTLQITATGTQTPLTQTITLPLTVTK